MRYLPVVLAIALLGPYQATSAAAQVVTGTTAQMGNTSSDGVTSYTVVYSYPSSAQVGTDLNVSLSLHVGQFSGRFQYIVGYSMTLRVDIGSEVPLSQIVTGPEGFNSSSFLYPGGIWGPVNYTFPLTANNTGLSPGQTANATLGVTLEDLTYVVVPPAYYAYVPEPSMQAQVGTLLIGYPSASSTTTASQSSTAPTLVPYALVASGLVLMAAAVFLPRGPRPPDGGRKP